MKLQEININKYYQTLTLKNYILCYGSLKKFANPILNKIKSQIFICHINDPGYKKN